MNTAYQTFCESGWPFPACQHSLPELFIIESMRDDDEDAGYFEGVRIAQMLRLGNHKPKYFYVQDARELELLVPVFRQSNYRYLHFSCHGDEKGFELTNGYLSFARFAEIFGASLKLRRLFVSACEAGQRELVDALHCNSRGIQSITAPRVKIDYDHAAGIWSTFYLSLLDKSSGKVRHNDVKRRIATLVRLFPWANREDKIAMSFMFAGYASNKDGGPEMNPDPWNLENITKMTQF